MQTFKDEQGRTWNLKATVNAIQRIKDQAEVDLLRLLDDKEIVGEAISNPVTFVAMLWSWCEPQANTHGVSPEQFGELIYGETFDAALTAFQLELPNFFPQHRRIMVEQMIRRTLQAEEMAGQRMTTLLQSDKVEQAMTKAMDRAEEQAIKTLDRIAGGDSSTN